jgi:hypothetical protein
MKKVIPNQFLKDFNLKRVWNQLETILNKYDSYKKNHQ